MSSASLRRLMQEALALDQNPLVRGSAAPCGGNMYKWKLIVVGEPPYDFPIRIHLDYSSEYPNVAPKAYFETPVEYIGGASYTADNGLQAVCLNIFGNFAHVHTEWKDQQSGWTPAYTIETIITSIQGLMMDEMLSQDPKAISKARRAALSFKCRDTGHDGSDPAKWWPPVQMSAPAPAAAGSGSKSTGESKGAASSEEKDYVCYVTKSLPKDHLLGFGIGIEGQKNKSFSSPCELMSYEAFSQLGVRSSSTNKPLVAWLPILTPYRHWDDVKQLFYENIQELMRLAGRPYDAALSPLQVCFSIMNTLVVEIMNAKNNLTANDKFIEGYFVLYRLLLAHSGSFPQVEQYVDAQIAAFVGSAENRRKEKVPNLGEFILYPLLSRRYNWKDISQAFVAECDARCVFWYTLGTSNQPGRYPELLSTSSADPSRVGKVFEATETSRNLVCYQKQFMRYAKSLNLQEVEANRGFVPEAMKSDVKDFYKRITAMRSWDEYYGWLEMAAPVDRESELRAAVDLSARNGYHRGGGGNGGWSQQSRGGSWQQGGQQAYRGGGGGGYRRGRF